MRTISSNNTTVLPLGKQGENLAEKIIFTDPISWLKGYGPGTVQLLNQRPGEAEGGTIVFQYMPHELVGNYFMEVS